MGGLTAQVFPKNVQPILYNGGQGKTGHSGDIADVVLNPAETPFLRRIDVILTGSIIDLTALSWLTTSCAFSWSSQKPGSAIFFSNPSR